MPTRTPRVAFGLCLHTHVLCVHIIRLGLPNRLKILKDFPCQRIYLLHITSYLKKPWSVFRMCGRIVQVPIAPFFIHPSIFWPASVSLSFCLSIFCYSKCVRLAPAHVHVHVCVHVYGCVCLWACVCDQHVHLRPWFCVNTLSHILCRPLRPQAQRQLTSIVRWCTHSCWLKVERRCFEASISPLAFLYFIFKPL